MNTHYSKGEIDLKFDGISTLINVQSKVIIDRLDKVNGSVARHEVSINETDKFHQKVVGGATVGGFVVMIVLGVFSWTLLTVVQLKTDVAKVQPEAMQAVVQQAIVDGLKGGLVELKNKP